VALVLICLIAALLIVAVGNASHERKQQSAVKALATQLRIEFPDHAGIITEDYAQQVTNTIDSYRSQTKPVLRKLSRLTNGNKKDFRGEKEILQQTLERMQVDYNNKFIAHAPEELQYCLAELTPDEVFDRHLRALERAKIILS